MGTPWITQRGFKEAEIDRLGDLIADLLLACVPFSYMGKKRAEPRAKVDFETLMSVKQGVRDLAASVGIDTDSGGDGYPHTYYADAEAGEGAYALAVRSIPGYPGAAAFLNVALTSDVPALGEGEQQPALVLDVDGKILSRAVVERQGADYLLHVEKNAGKIAAWLRALSDGFALSDRTDPYGKVPGPVDVVVRRQIERQLHRHRRRSPTKPISSAPTAISSPPSMAIRCRNSSGAIRSATRSRRRRCTICTFSWARKWRRSPATRCRSGTSRSLTSIWRCGSARASSTSTHMGVFDAQGAGAAAFLDTVTTNEVSALAVGKSHYTYLLDVHGIPLDDLMIYRLSDDHYLIVVNASNNDKNWAWLNAVKNGEVHDRSRRIRRASLPGRIASRCATCAPSRRARIGGSTWRCKVPTASGFCWRSAAATRIRRRLKRWRGRGSLA